MKLLDAAWKLLPLIAMFFVGWSVHGLAHRRPSSEPSRGAFAVPQSGIKYVPPPGETVKSWECLVAVTGDNPAVWRYRVWREDDPSKALTGKGAVVVPQ